jgi:hypothetical protein
MVKKYPVDRKSLDKYHILLSLEIYYDDLVADPKQAVERIYSHFNLPMGDEHRLFLEAESQKARSYKSKHHYSLEQFGLSKQQVYEALEDVFEAYGFGR